MTTQQLLFNEPDLTVEDDALRTANSITRITVERLFGQFNYTLPHPKRSADLSKVFILYGDNGSGKTTILNTLFHLLSRANNRGHRNALSRIPFKRFEVSLSDGSRLAAFRNGELVGSYTLEAECGSHKVHAFFDSTKDKKFGSPEEEQSLIEFLKRLNQTVYLLSADRTIMSDALPPVEAEDITTLLMAEGEQDFDPQTLMRARVQLMQRSRRDLPLIRALQLANDWFRRQAIQATTRGTENANTIYTDIIKRIAESPHSSSDAAGFSPEALSKTLQELSHQNAEFARFQFTSSLQFDDILAALTRVDDTKAAVIADVLEPYIDGTRARLDALAKLQRTIATLVESLNSFYTRKRVTFAASEGLRIKQEDGTLLEPSALSSGEQHMLLMFCHIVLPQRGQTVFIIDEPELSLNVKWQRKLIGALREVVADAQVQFIFASHSIEFLSEHLEEVVELTAEDLTASAVPTPGGVGDPANNS